MGIFGWSYPPGCSGPPEDVEETPFINDTIVFLQDYHVPDDIIDKVLVILREWENKLIEEHNSELKTDARLLDDEPA